MTYYKVVSKNIFPLLLLLNKRLENVMFILSFMAFEENCSYEKQFIAINLFALFIDALEEMQRSTVPITGCLFALLIYQVNVQ